MPPILHQSTRRSTLAYSTDSIDLIGKFSMSNADARVKHVHVNTISTMRAIVWVTVKSWRNLIDAVQIPRNVSVEAFGAHLFNGSWYCNGAIHFQNVHHTAGDDAVNRKIVSDGCPPCSQGVVDGG